MLVMLRRWAAGRCARLQRRSVPRHCTNGFSTQIPDNNHATKGKRFKILFFGRDEFSCLVLEQLYAANDVWEGIWIATNPDVKVGRRGSKLSISPLKVLGERLALPVNTIPPDKASFKKWQLPPPFLPASTPPNSHLLVTASFGRILPTSMLDLFQQSRRLNVHPSLLPDYRGAAPIQHTLLDGRTETGVCVIEMMERKRGIDAGQIWGRTSMPIPEGSYFSSLRDRLAVEGGNLLVSVLRDMLAGKANSILQPHDPNAPRAPFITADDSLVDFTSMSAESVVRRHRAISHQKPLFAYLKTGRTLQLHSVSASAPSDLPLDLPQEGMMTYNPFTKALIIRCASDTLLSVGQVKQQDRALINAKEWWNGVRPEMRVTYGDIGPVLLLRQAVCMPR